MANYTINVSQTVSATESKDMLAGGARGVIVIESLSVSEHVDILLAGGRDITVSDTITTLENNDVLLAGARNIAASDNPITTENISFVTLTNPMFISRISVLSLVVPGVISLTIAKKSS